MLEFPNDITLSYFKPITDLLQFSSNMSYQERVKARYEYVQKQLKANPNYEGWDYIDYWDYSPKSNEPGELITSRTALISTRGTLAKIKYNTICIIATKGYMSDRYLKSTFRDTNEGSHKVFIHRLVACTFVPLDEDKQDIPYNQLIANHESNNKMDNRFSNLKWMTQQENIAHAIEHGAFYFTSKEDLKPMVGRYIIPGKWEGTEFFVVGKRELIDAGFDADSVHKAARGSIQSAHGCEWKRIELSEIGDHQTGKDSIDPELLELMTNDRGKSSRLTKPILATITKEGEFKGQQFVIYGRKRLVELGFDQGHVSRVCNGRASLKTHKGCKWEYVTPEESEEFQRDPTKEQLDFLKGK